MPEARKRAQSWEVTDQLHRPVNDPVPPSIGIGDPTAWKCQRNQQNASGGIDKLTRIGRKWSSIGHCYPDAVAASQVASALALR